MRPCDGSSPSPATGPTSNAWSRRCRASSRPTRTTRGRLSLELIDPEGDDVGSEATHAAKALIDAYVERVNSVGSLRWGRMFRRLDLLGRALRRDDDRSDAGPGRKEIPPTGKAFDVDFFTVAKWDDGQIVEENLMYDLVTFMRQIGLSS